MLKNNQATISVTTLAKRMSMSLTECSNVLNGLFNRGLVSLDLETTKQGKTKESFNLNECIKFIEDYFYNEMRSKEAEENQDEIKQNCLQILEKFNVREHLFASELDVLNKDFDEPLCDTIGWRYEAANALLWSIGLVDDIVSADWPEDVEVELNKVFNLVTTYNTFDDFIAACNLKQEYELQDAFQLYWYYHWNIRDGQIFGNIPESVSYDVVMERRRALEWLLYSAESDDGDWEFGMHT
jgi:predicted transcriptional regulator